MPHPDENEVVYNGRRLVFPYLTVSDGVYALQRGLASGAMFTTIVDPADASRRVQLDSLFQSLFTIQGPHHEIHEGAAFVCDAVDTAMANAETLALAFKTPTGTKRTHMIFDFTDKVGGHAELIEAPTWDTGSGSQNTIFNRKRLAVMTESVLLEDTTSSFVANNAMVLNPTNLAGGTVIHDLYAFGSQNRATDRQRDANEFILKLDTLYAYRFTADGAANAGHVALDWYEHQDH